jgi:hypothetical protein
MTPLMLAVATDHPSDKIIQMLLEKKAATDTKSLANETALDWAAKFQNPSVLPVIQKASPGMTPAKREPVSIRAANRELRDAAAQSIALLQKTNVTFLREGGCVSCHAQNITSVAVAAARSKGVPVDEPAASEVARGTRLQFSAFAEALLERMDPPAVQIPIYALFGLAAERTEPDRITDALVHNIAAQQHTGGAWASRTIVRPPTGDLLFSYTAFAIRTLRHFGPPSRKAEMDERIARAAKWLMKSTPSTTEDHVMRLLGAKWAGLDGSATAGLPGMSSPCSAKMAAGRKLHF